MVAMDEVKDENACVHKECRDGDGAGTNEHPHHTQLDGEEVDQAGVTTAIQLGLGPNGHKVDAWSIRLEQTQEWM